MAFDLSVFEMSPGSPGHAAPDEAYLQSQLSLAREDSAMRFARLMAYYRNDLRDAWPLRGSAEFADSSRPYVQAQEYGLPARITGFRHDGFGAIHAGERVNAIRRKEVVIENDIGWRVDTMVNYLFGRPVHVRSQAADESLRQRIETALNAALEANGGLTFLQQLALFGHVYGFVDLMVRGAALNRGDLGGELAAAGIASEAQGPADSLGAIAEAARGLTFELIEADRAVPIVNVNDYRELDYYVQHFRQRVNRIDGEGFERSVMVTEIVGPTTWQRYHDEELVASGDNPLGRIPVVHVQNLPRPFYYEGESEVERLVGLQDELNTRLSDRANRITFQSFKMYLGRGIDNFEGRPIAPGRMWSTDNPEASIQEFGGDPGSPSEEHHIEQIREALDKVSGVPPVAAGVVRDRLGNLTSGTALRLTLASLLSKTAAKRALYGRGIEQVCELTLAWLDAAGVLATRPADRRVQIEWPALPCDSEAEQLQTALLKRQVGVPADRVLADLGYANLTATSAE